MAKTTQKIRIYSALEVANICGVVNQTAINWIRNGYLRAFSTPGGQYRVYEEDLTGFLSGHGMRNSIAALHLVDKSNSVPGDTTSAENETMLITMSITALIIDHEYDPSRRLKKWLKDTFSNYEILQAHDGFEAAWLFCQSRPGLVFLNVDLPGINVHAMARKFRKDPAPGNPRLIALVPDTAGEAQRAPWADACFPRRLNGDHARNTLLNLMQPQQIPVTA
jgi:excisionase family DNA binding protein